LILQEALLDERHFERAKSVDSAVRKKSAGARKVIRLKVEFYFISPGLQRGSQEIEGQPWFAELAGSPDILQMADLNGRLKS